MTIHPLLKLVMSKPRLLGEHAEAYLTLFGDEAKKASVSVAMQAAYYAGAGILALLGLVFVGVALLLRATIPSIDYPAGWALLVVPLTPFVIAAVLVFLARSKPIDAAFGEVRKQIQADLGLLRELSAK